MTDPETGFQLAKKEGFTVSDQGCEACSDGGRMCSGTPPRKEGIPAASLPCCGTCQFWRPDYEPTAWYDIPQVDGRCRRHTPTFSGFPGSQCQQWCGEYSRYAGHAKAEGKK